MKRQTLIANDELNNIRSMDFETYFGNMYLTIAEKRRRIKLAQILEDFFIDFLYEISLLTDADIFELGFIEADFFEQLFDLLKDYNVDTKQQIHFQDVLRETAEATLRHIDESYYLSADRARFIAENESNTYWNYEEFQRAIVAGKTMKTWHTMMDDKVRMSHELVEEETIPILEPFVVGTSQMMFPKDESLGADPEELIGCRCSVSYE